MAWLQRNQLSPMVKTAMHFTFYMAPAAVKAQREKSRHPAMRLRRAGIAFV